MSDEDLTKKQMTLRMSIVYLLLILIAIGIIARIIYLQTSERQFWKQQAKERTIQERTFKAKRGNIYAIDSDNGDYLLLATDVPQYELYLDLGKGYEYDRKQRKKIKKWVVSEKTFNEGLNALCDSLYNMFRFNDGNKTSYQYKNYFKNNRKKENRYVLVAKEISSEQLERMKQFPIIGKQIFKRGKPTNKYIFTNAVCKVESSRRVYPYYPLARRTIGINVTINGCDTCYNGIDGAFSKYLSGKRGKRLERKINPGEWVPVDTDERIKAVDGFDVVSTLDIRLQELAESSLRQCLNENEAESGCVVLMEVETGYIRAISNLIIDDEGEYRESNNIAISASFEPGSTFKTVTAMMLLDKGLADTSDLVPTGVKDFPGSEKPIKDVGETNHGLISFARALEISSNVGVSQLVYDKYGQSSNRENFRKDLSEYFRFEPLNLDIDVHEPRPKIGSSKNMTDLLRMSFGYVTRMTPLQLLTFYNAIANNGKMVKPMFVSSILKDGQTIKTFEPTVISESICKPETRSKIHNILKGVVQNGTGRRLKGTSYGIAGKSGTAEIGYDKKHVGIQHRASFVGYFPADEPKYSCIVVISKPQKARTHGGDLAAPVFRNLADRVAGSLIEFSKIKSPKNDRKIPIMKYGNAYNYHSFCKALGLDTKTPSSEWIKMKRNGESVEIIPQIIKQDKVPNVTGLTIRDAVLILENMGLKVKFSGKGKVASQSIAAGSDINKNGTIFLLLKSPAKETNRKHEETKTI